MRVISVNVGLPRTLEWHGRSVTTSIFKDPVEGRVRAVGYNLDGDRQSDLTVHGGRDKAVYAYPIEHYEFWREELGVEELPYGAFGENLTVEGFREDRLEIGDVLRVGTATFRVTQPRLPCFKLGVRFDRADVVKMFFEAERPGFYLSILGEGDVGQGDAIELEPSWSGVTVVDLTQFVAESEVDPEIARRALALDYLPPFWQRTLRKAIEEI